MPRARPAPAESRGAPSAEDRAARAAEDRRLLERYHRSGDRSAREEVVQRFLPLARQLARRYAGAGEPLEDLVQVASLGLVKAVDRFDPSARRRLLLLRRPDHPRRAQAPLPRQGLVACASRATCRSSRCAWTARPRSSARELGRAPTPAEVAERLGVSEEDVLEAREAAHAYRAVSLDRPRTEDDESGPAVADSMGGEDPGFRRAEDAATVDQLLRVLAPREREVLRLRFVEDLTQQEIGDRIGVSQMHVSRLIRQAIARLGDAAGG